MREKDEDFWPAEFPDPSDPVPVALLKEQASLLGNKTGGDIVAFVRMDVEDEIACHTLSLRAVPLGNANEFGILTISYPVSTPNYPINANMIVGMRDLDLKTEVTIKNDEDFRRWLREQLSSPEVKYLIGFVKKYIDEVRESRASWARM